MGLSISVGLLGTPELRDDAEVLHRALGAEGVVWREPVAAPGGPAEVFSAGFPYSYLAGLRRVYVLHRLGEPVTGARGVSREQYEADLELVDDETVMFDSHLLCHADHAGYYVPAESAFEDPLFLPEEADVPGAGMVGSSGALLAELQGFAAAIGIRPAADGSLDPAESRRLEALPGDDPFEPEVFAWHQLFRACSGQPRHRPRHRLQVTVGSGRPGALVRRPGVPASRRPGVPASRRPGVPASRRPGVPASRLRLPGRAPRRR
ncbi:hypothetical protein ACFV1W_36690 [Kitasatospora sp. NPDC059648]|uniref:hypothetical protein n=1 Tax=Kitasatospora sp. NPDC059648 TaxID=3346894 RepID=UPI0036AF49F1